MRLQQFINEAGIPDLKDGEYAIPYRKKEKNRKMNPKTNRMKNFKKNRYFVTDIKPEDRSMKNLPRYADKSSKCTFTQWLDLKGGGSNGAKGCDGKYYGWSHRAVWGFGVGDVIKKGHIGNKHEYGDKAMKKYREIEKKHGYAEADKWIKTIKFEPYTIKTEKEAKEHAIRFGRDVS